MITKSIQSILAFALLVLAIASVQDVQAKITDTITASTMRTSDAASKTEQTAVKKSPSEELPKIEIVCTHIIDRELLSGFLNKSQQEYKNANDDNKNCFTGNLIGSGDVVLVINSSSYEEMLNYQSKNNGKATLFINGVNLMNDAKLVGIERFTNIYKANTTSQQNEKICNQYEFAENYPIKEFVCLHYSIKPGTSSRLLWATLYKSGKTDHLHPMRVGLGWSSGLISTSFPQSAASVNDTNGNIAITDTESFYLGIGFIFAIVLFGIYLAESTDIFRDTKTPEVLIRAIKIRSKINLHNEKNQLTKLYSNYDEQNKAEYTSLADQSLKNEDVEKMDMDKLAVGLILRREKWSNIRSTYSLGRIQLGMWFLFAVATGVYLWTIYGALPEIEGSVLTLLGVSMGATGMSLATDKNLNICFKPSQGILQDLITGWDEQHQVHRFQAVLVNLLLLTVGIVHVLQNLAYPVFEPSWLAFLTISGVAVAAGKNITERNKTPI